MKCLRAFFVTLPLFVTVFAQAQTHPALGQVKSAGLSVFVCQITGKSSNKSYSSAEFIFAKSQPEAIANYFNSKVRHMNFSGDGSVLEVVAYDANTAPIRTIESISCVLSN